MSVEINLSGKTVLITGAGSGNGLAISKRLKQSGAKIIGVDKVFSDSPEIEQTVNKFHCDYIYSIDFTVINFLEMLINNLYDDKLFKIDALINNAGISLSNKFDSYNYKDWAKTIHLNLTVPFLLTRKLASEFMVDGGRIVNITSLASELGFPENPSYAASKGGLKSLTTAMAVDLGHRNICVNSVAPGYIRTSMTKNSWDNPSLKAERDKRIIFDRWGEPKDVADLVLFLCSDLASYITGQNIFVDGGWSIKGL